MGEFPPCVFPDAEAMHTAVLHHPCQKGALIAGGAVRPSGPGTTSSCRHPWGLLRCPKEVVAVSAQPHSIHSGGFGPGLGRDVQRRRITMRHNIVYWKMERREAEVDDLELARLREQERHGELYLEFLDGVRRPLNWDHDTGHWAATMPERQGVAA